MSTYSIIGLGKLGASMAAAIAKRGFKVIGLAINQQSVTLLEQGQPPVQETDLAETITANQERLRATTSYRITTPDPVFKALKASDFRHHPVTVVDFWRILEAELTGKPHIHYVPIGRSIDDAVNTARIDKPAHNNLWC